MLLVLGDITVGVLNITGEGKEFAKMSEALSNSSNGSWPRAIAQRSNESGTITGTYEVFLNNTEGREPKKIPFGVKVRSRRDADGSTGHFMKAIQEDSLAEQLKFRDDDEILFVQDQLIFNTSHESVVKTLKTLHIDEELRLLIRRHDGMHIAESTHTGCDFFDTTGTVTLVTEGDKLVPKVVQPKQIQIGDFYFLKKTRTQTGSLHTRGNYLKVSNGDVKVTRSHKDTDPAYCFDILHYPCYKLTNPPQAKAALMLRHHPPKDTTHANYVVVNQQGKLILEEKRSDSQDGPDMIFRDAALFYHDLALNQFGMEVAIRLGTFISANDEEGSRLSLIPVEDISANPYIRFYMRQPKPAHG